jgi:hypothetical protein
MGEKRSLRGFKKDTWRVAADIDDAARARIAPASQLFIYKLSLPDRRRTPPKPQPLAYK